jgi:5-methyltetrahydrofolate--homocysteine methyltransferase
LSSERDAFAAKTKNDYERIREERGKDKSAARFFSIAEARKNAFPSEWPRVPISKPAEPGIKAFDNFPLREIADKIDWSPFFHTWELRGRYPDIFKDPKTGKEAKKLFDDAEKLLKEIVKNNLLTARGVIGLFPANSVGDDIEVYTDESRSKVMTTFHTLRQQMLKPAGEHNLALADFVAPKSSGIQDYIGGFVVTAGIGADELAKKFEKEHDDYHSIMVKALADRLAEAFAERLHQLVRKYYWGYAKNEALTTEDLIQERYRGIRPAAGYPACPDHTEKKILFRWLEAEKNAGVSLTESCAMYPGASVSGLYFAHPESRYFTVGKLEKDQIEDYARRKGMNVQDAERWLSPNLNY